MHSLHSNVFYNRKDTFSIQCGELGELTKVRVRHDNTGVGPGWLLDSVEVKCEESEGVWVFPCGQWLEMCDGCGGKLEVELAVGETEERKKDSDERELLSALTLAYSVRKMSHTHTHTHTHTHSQPHISTRSKQ